MCYKHECGNSRMKDFERLAGGEIFGQKKLIRNLSAGNIWPSGR